MFNPSVEKIPKLVIKKNANSNNNDDDVDESEKKSFFHDKVVRAFKKDPLVWITMFFVFLSTLFLFILLIGGSKAIFLSKFTFDDPIKFITGKNEIIFTLYGTCVDDQCSQASLTNNFDQMPSASEIANSTILNTKRFNPSDVGSTVGSTVGTVGSTVGSTVGTVGSTVDNAGNTAVDTAKKIAEEAPGLLSSLLNGLANFKPKVPTVNLSGFFSVPYLFTMMFNLIALFFLFFQINFFAVTFILISSILNLIALIFDLLLFVWVFDVVAIIPGIGSQHTGPGIHLAAWSAVFLIIAIIILCFRFGGNAVRSVAKKLRKLKAVDEQEEGQKEISWV